MSFVSGIGTESGGEAIRFIALPDEPWSIHPPTILVSPTRSPDFLVANGIPAILGERTKAWLVSPSAPSVRPVDPSVVTGGPWVLAPEARPVSEPAQWDVPSSGRTVEGLLSPDDRFVATLSFRGIKIKRPVFRFISYPDPSAKGFSLVDSWIGRVRLVIVEKTSRQPVASMRRTVVNAQAISPPRRLGIWLPQSEAFVVDSELAAGGPLVVMYTSKFIPRSSGKE
jgi:hypothetical protein